MVTLDLIIKLIYFSLALVGAFFGATIIIKSGKELKKATLYLTIALVSFVFYASGGILNLYGAQGGIINILHLAVIILVLLALVNIHLMISNVRKASKIQKEPKKEPQGFRKIPDIKIS